MQSKKRLPVLSPNDKSQRVETKCMWLQVQAKAAGNEVEVKNTHAFILFWSAEYG